MTITQNYFCFLLASNWSLTFSASISHAAHYLDEQWHIVQAEGYFKGHNTWRICCSFALMRSHNNSHFLLTHVPIYSFWCPEGWTMPRMCPLSLCCVDQVLMPRTVDKLCPWVTVKHKPFCPRSPEWAYRIWHTVLLFYLFLLFAASYILLSPPCSWFHILPFPCSHCLPSQQVFGSENCHEQCKRTHVKSLPRLDMRHSDDNHWVWAGYSLTQQL